MAMKAERRTTAVGVFEDRRHAEQAVTELRQAGFRDDQIGIAGRRTEEEARATTTDETGETGAHTGTGAVVGAVAGAGIGGLVGLGIISGVIPVLGPIIAGGTLAAILANAAGGAVIGGLVGALTGAGIPEEEAQYYQSEFESGRTIVTVHADGRYDEAVAILRQHGAYDMHSAASRATGTTGTTTGTMTGGTMTGTSAATATGSAVGTAAGHTAGSRVTEGGRTVQVKQEELHAHKQPVETGEVRVRKEVHTEHQTTEVPVRKEEVVIERHAPTGHGATSDIRPGEEIRVPVMEEQVTVEKRPVVTEEVTVGKRAVQGTERVAGEVRKEEIRVEREGDVDIRKKPDR